MKPGLYEEIFNDNLPSISQVHQPFPRKFLVKFHLPVSNISYKYVVCVSLQTHQKEEKKLQM